MKPGRISRPQRRRVLKVTAASAFAAPFLMPTCSGAQQGGYELLDDPTLSTLVQTSAGGPSPAGPDAATVRWLGCSNHELAFRDKFILFDAYDPGPRNRPLGFAPQDVTRADLIINGHAISTTLPISPTRAAALVRR
jgi:hypothetical protein